MSAASFDALVQAGALRSVDPHVEAEHAPCIVDDLDPNLAADLLHHSRKRSRPTGSIPLLPHQARYSYKSLHLNLLSVGGRPAFAAKVLTLVGPRQPSLLVPCDEARASPQPWPASACDGAECRRRPCPDHHPAAGMATVRRSPSRLPSRLEHRRDNRPPPPSGLQRQHPAATQGRRSGFGFSTSGALPSLVRTVFGVPGRALRRDPLVPWREHGRQRVPLGLLLSFALTAVQTTPFGSPARIRWRISSS